MNVISNRGLLLAALLLSLIGLALTAARSEAARSFDTALVDANSFEHGADVVYDRAADSGIKYIKNNLYWSLILSNPEATQKPGTEAEPFDPTDPGSPYYTNWAPFDHVVREASERGLKVIFSAVAAPRWARISACKSSGVCSPRPAEYADFATAAATRYSGTYDPGDGKGVLPRVRFWQAWVEPNLSLFYQPIFKPNGSALAPYRYRVLLNRFYDAIHAIDDRNFVIAGGLAPNRVPGKAIAPLDFTRKALCMKGNFRKPRPKRRCNYRVKADAWAVHPYTTGSPIHQPRRPDNMSIATLPWMNKLLRKANRANHLISEHGRTRLWVTEFSWDSRPPDPGGVPSGLLNRWVSQAMYMMYKARVQTMTWFGLRDQARDGDTPWTDTFESGLYRRGETIFDDRAKPVLKAFRQPFYAERTRRGIRFWGRTADSKRAWVNIFGRRKRKGRFHKVATVRANANGLFAKAIRRRGFTRRGAVYAKPRGGEASYAFGLWKTKDCRQPPFGGKHFNRRCLGRG